METKDIGRLFRLRGSLTHPKGKRLVFRQHAFELDPPYRYANTFVLRLPHGKGLMLGWWKKSPADSLQDHFAMALGGASLDIRGGSFYNNEPQRAEKIGEIPIEDLTDDQRKEAGSRSMFVAYDSDPI